MTSFFENKYNFSKLDPLKFERDKVPYIDISTALRLLCNTVKMRYYAVLLGDRNLKILHNNGHFFFSSDDIEKKLFHKFSVNSIVS